MVDRRRACARAAAGPALDGTRRRLPCVRAGPAVSPVRRPAQRRGGELRRRHAAVRRLAGRSRAPGAGPGRAAAGPANSSAPRSAAGGAAAVRRRARVFWARCPGRGCWSSKTCTGRTRAACSCWITWPTTRRCARRCWSRPCAPRTSTSNCWACCAGWSVSACSSASSSGPLPVEATVQLLREVVREDVRQLGQQLHAETEGNPAVRRRDNPLAARVGRAAARPGRATRADAAAGVGSGRDPRAAGAARCGCPRAGARGGGAGRRRRLRPRAQQSPARTKNARWPPSSACCRRTCLREVTGEVGEALYSFSHDKVRQVVYDDLSGARRRVQHRRALDVLAQPAARTPVERLAYHAMRAQAWDQAVRWCEQAADGRGCGVCLHVGGAACTSRRSKGSNACQSSADNQAMG